MVDETLVRSYLARIKKEREAGDITEHTHRPALKDLIECLCTEITDVNEPKRLACGAHDFVVKKRDLEKRALMNICLALAEYEKFELGFNQLIFTGKYNGSSLFQVANLTLS